MSKKIAIWRIGTTDLITPDVSILEKLRSVIRHGRALFLLSLLYASVASIIGLRILSGRLSDSKIELQNTSKRLTEDYSSLKRGGGK